LEHVRRDWNDPSTPRRPTLIIVPPNIACQWKNECDKYVNDLPIYFMYGPTYRNKMGLLVDNKLAIVLSTPQTFSKYIKTSNLLHKCRAALQSTSTVRM
jgi:hypothetical protein